MLDVTALRADMPWRAADFEKLGGGSIAVSFHQSEDKDICEVVVRPSPKAVFFISNEKEGVDEEFFFVRTGNSTNRLLIADAVEYIRTRWG